MHDLSLCARTVRRTLLAATIKNKRPIYFHINAYLGFFLTARRAPIARSVCTFHGLGASTRPSEYGENGFSCVPYGVAARLTRKKGTQSWNVGLASVHYYV